jgi:hypothetical protein
MRAARIIADRHMANVEAAKSFYTDHLGVSTVDFDMGRMARCTSPRTPARVSGS